MTTFTEKILGENMSTQSLRPSQFYSKNMDRYQVISMSQARHNASQFTSQQKREMPARLMGPTQFWQQFYKQADALEVARDCSTVTETLCTFVYQKQDGYRQFVVAHPEVYWWYDSQRSAEQRCSYEVIPEDSPSWLYFDLEYQTELNPDSDGPKMTDTLIKIFRDYLSKYYALNCDETNVVNLDSTTSTKFSRHLIFCIKDVAFKNNFHVGCLVKGVCREIEDYLEDSNGFHSILSHYERKDLEELFVKTDKKTKIFVDTGVYTRNRHFRIYKSTKWGKLSNLTVAPQSKHKPLEIRGDNELAIFLDSLISYFPNKKNLSLLEVNENDLLPTRSRYCATSPSQRVTTHENSNASRYPELDKFVLSLVSPGKIRCCKQFSEKSIFYEIIGHRYCANIGRQHKSNNVYWVADLHHKTVYQKCHDEECMNFASKPIDMPQEVSFQLADELDDLLLNLSEHEVES